MTEVRRHKRQTATGKTTTVRQHHRNTGDGIEYVDATRPAFTPEQAAMLGGDPAPPDETWWDEGPAGESWDDASQPPVGWSPEAEQQLRGQWDGEKEQRLAAWHAEVAESRGSAGRPENVPLTRMQQEMRDWRALGEPEVPPDDKPMSVAEAKLFGCDTPEGRARYDRLRAYREAGYEGPLDQDNRIPDPDDPANWQTLDAGAALRETQHYDGPVAFGGGRAVDGDLRVTEEAPPRGRARDGPGGATFGGPVSFAPGAVVSFGEPAAGRNVNYYYGPDDEETHGG